MEKKTVSAAPAAFRPTGIPAGGVPAASKDRLGKTGDARIPKSTAGKSTENKQSSSTVKETNAMKPKAKLYASIRCEVEAISVFSSIPEEAGAQLMNCAPGDAGPLDGPADGSPVAADDVFGDGGPDSDDDSRDDDDYDYDDDCEDEYETDGEDDGEDDGEWESEEYGEDGGDYRYASDDLTEEEDNEILWKDRIKAIEKEDNWGDFM